jgi:hypothetical protein
MMVEGLILYCAVFVAPLFLVIPWGAGSRRGRVVDAVGSGLSWGAAVGLCLAVVGRGQGYGIPVMVGGILVALLVGVSRWRRSRGLQARQEAWAAGVFAGQHTEYHWRLRDAFFLVARVIVALWQIRRGTRVHPSQGGPLVGPM